MRIRDSIHRGGKRKLLLLMALALVVGLAVVACGGDGDSAAPPPAPAAGEPPPPAPPPADEPPPPPPPADEPPPPPADEPPPPPEEPPAMDEGCQVEGVGDDGIIRAFQTQDISQVIGTISVHAQRGAEIALEVLAEQGGILGCELVIDNVDEPFDGNDPAPCLRNYREAIQSGNYDFYFGSTSSACMFALPDLTKAAGQFLFSGIAADHQPFMANYPAQGPYLMQGMISTFLEGRSMANWAIDNGFQRAAVMVPNYAYGQDVGSSFVELFEAAGLTVVSQQFPEFNEENLTPFINAMVAEDPDLIVMAMFGNFILPFWQQWKDCCADLGIATVTGLAFSSTFEVPGLSSDDYADNTFAYNRGDWHLRCATPSGAELCQRWAQKYGEGTGDELPIPGAFAFIQYGDIQAAAAVIESTGTLDPDAWVELIESGDLCYDNPYQANQVCVNPINHMSNNCAEVGLITEDPALPLYPISYDPNSFNVYCMNDVLPAEEVRSLTDNPAVDDATFQIYLDNVEANLSEPTFVTELPGP
jgi:ABC-type branched-subunit amino acid transport system substrate-binding protein